MKKKVLLGIKLLLAAGLACGLFVIGRQEIDYKRGEGSYEDAEQIAGIVQLPDQLETAAPGQEAGDGEAAAAEAVDPYKDMLSKIDLGALRQVNGDVVGWIAIPKTELSYPMLQRADNDYYLDHTWKNERNSVGAIFMECKIDAGLDDFNTIVYGHRMRNLSMFGSLRYYDDLEYLKEHPSVYVAVDSGVYKYDIYAAYEVGLRTITYRLDVDTPEEKEECIRFGLESSVIDAGVVPAAEDKILTLSTCTGRGHATRWVVQAVCRGEEEKEELAGR